MILLVDLWLPILLSAIFVFIVSSIIHTVLHIHKRDYTKLPGEDEVLKEMRAQDVKSGTYMFPCPESTKDRGSPEMVEKYKQGPVGFMTVMPSGTLKMGKSLMQWFLYSLVISIFVAYIAKLGLGRGTDFIMVFRVTSAAAILGYALSYLPDSIWKGASWGTTMKFIFDGVIYGLVTAATFGWLWPDAA